MRTTVIAQELEPDIVQSTSCGTGDVAALAVHITTNAYGQATTLTTGSNS